MPMDFWGRGEIKFFMKLSMRSIRSNINALRGSGRFGLLRENRRFFLRPMGGDAAIPACAKD